ncbi:hypothetical protein KY328_03340 [Candidatus Woesearchaeota archaeon]|nr:hypothetical protein [Candidatus Woesearchaeota archaeon]MBW3021928.1 hypothetical protein [Candidatus Woesearchaeota archaeon]
MRIEVEIRMDEFYLRGVRIPFEPSIPNYFGRKTDCELNLALGKEHIGPIVTAQNSDMNYCAHCQKRI